MADFIDEFFTYCKAQSTITDLIGTGTAARIFPDTPKQNTARPYVFIEQTGGETVDTLSSSLRGGGLETEVIDVYAVDDDKPGAAALQEAMRLKLHNYRGLMGSTHVSEVTIVGGREQGVDLPQDGSSTPRYWCKRSYQFIHQLPTS